jgi:glyoxalase family protein
LKFRNWSIFMNTQINGIHHVTAMAGDPQRNLDFYTDVLGLRLVKLTVNFDDPGTYHFYFGDHTGRPGSILTFFPWPDARPGVRGVGQLTATAFAIPKGSLSFWQARLKEKWVRTDASRLRFGDEVLTFYDPDDLRLELIETADLGDFEPWQEGPVPPQHAIHGFHSVTLTERDLDRTAAVLYRMGLKLVGQEEGRTRFTAGVDVLVEPNSPAGRVSVGTVHHLAFRTPDDESQLAWQSTLAEAGLGVTEVRDRQYFRSIYFREPGGVLFEIATDSPGFATDEPVKALGTSLKLPHQYESQRAQIEAIVPPLHLPGTVEVE